MTDPIPAPSPNHSDRKGTAISFVVLHYTGMPTGAAALDRLRDPSTGVSAHYCIEEDGTLYTLVPEDRRAHHAGLGAWSGMTDINSASIGIELVNPGHFWGYRDYPEAQVTCLLTLLAGMIRRHSLPRRAVIGHSDVAPGRKDDPGERFPWDRLAAEGLALPPWPGGSVLTDPQERSEDPFAPYEAAIADLARIGYAVDPAFPVSATLAFQRRFAPELLGNGLCPRTRLAIAWAAEQTERDAATV